MQRFKRASRPRDSHPSTHPTLSRRAFIRRGLAMGLSLPFALETLTACESLLVARPAALAPVRFGVIGDYGKAGQAEHDVSELVKSWQPDFIVTLGDNNYTEGSAETIDENVGQYYHEFIGNYEGTYRPGATENRFWPVLGNHDWRTEQGQPYLDYFTLPGNERYYTFTRGPVQFFMLNSMPDEPDGVRQDSKQAAWLRNQLVASGTFWRVVVFHHAPYTSGANGSSTWMRWPFREWGASVVMSGHDHTYERLEVDGLTYIVNGLGGAGRYEEKARLDQSKVFFNKEHGALRVDANPEQMQFQFITSRGEVIDSFELGPAAR